MKRRNFIRLSAVTAISVQSSVLLTGCGGGGSGGSASGNRPTQGNTSQNFAATIDENVRAITALQKENRKLHAKIGQTNVSLLGASGSDTSNVQTSGKLFAAALQNKTASSESSEPDTATFFQNYKPDTTDTYFPQEKIWENYQKSHALAFEQLTSQLTKLKAGFRVYGHNKETQSLQENTDTPKAVSKKASAADNNVALFLHAVESFKKLDLSAAAIDGLTLSINLLYSVIDGIKDTETGHTILVVAFEAIESLLRSIKEKSLAHLSFSNGEEIALSLAKMAVAIVSVLGLSAISEYTSKNALTDDKTERETEALTQAMALQGQLILTLMAVVSKIIDEITETTTTLTGNVDSEDYELTEEDKALIEKLKSLSSVLTTLGLIVKALLVFYLDHTPEAEASDTMQGDAASYAPLFGNPTNLYDAYLSQFTSQNRSTLFPADSLLAQLLTTLGIVDTEFTVSTPTGAASATTEAESKAFAYASKIADPSYGIDLITPPEFAEHLADLAYQFVIKIEDDAYDFALKGMEYGYLFASRGEEVGLMADRILFMAVQIGAMADRIGEMADRIVYTEQLIVYTEMLILDFGMLIYGSMKTVSNFLLTGMAILFDREWYTQADQSSDPVLNVISKMTQTMLADMSAYEKQVLKNQTKLREETLEALKWIKGAY